MGLSGMMLGVVSFTAGAILYWAVTYQGPYIRLSTVGVILMVVGGVGFVVSAVIFGVTRSQAAPSRRTSVPASGDTDRPTA